MKELGDIEVLVWDDKVNEFLYQGGLFETGPIAINRQIVPIELKPNNSTMKVKLVMNKGLWRIDCTKLVELQHQVQPIAIKPNKIVKQDSTESIQLNTDILGKQHLVSLPGTCTSGNSLCPIPIRIINFSSIRKGIIWSGCGRVGFRIRICFS